MKLNKTSVSIQKIKDLYNKNTNVRRITQAVTILLVATVGSIVIGISLADTGTKTTPTVSSTCGKRVQNYTYRVPFGDAVWNQPVCNLPRHAQSADYANRLYQYGNRNDGTANASKYFGGIGINIGLEKEWNFSRNVYYAKDATTTIKIHASSYDSNLDGAAYNSVPLMPKPGGLSKNPDTPIPWNPAWETGTGGDNEIVILDENTGKIYELFGVKKDPTAAFLQCGIFANDRLCTYTVQIGRDHHGNIVDYRTFEGVIPSRGVGLSAFAMLVTPEEVAAGEIRHAIGLAIANTAVGPICTKAQLGTAAEGKTCGTALAPASKFEHGDKLVPPTREDLKDIYTQDKLIPEGMRFALDIGDDDTYINNWINSRPELKSNPRKAETARIFARALRDYGMIVADTNGSGLELQVAGAVNPDARQKWKDLGIEKTSDYQILKGLLSSTNIYVVEPPTNTCKDGSKSKYYCHWTDSSYGNSSGTPQPPQPQPNQAPSVALTSPTNNQVGTAPARFNLTANASDSDGRITKVEFFRDSIKIGEDTSAPYTHAISGLGVGEYRFSAKATDDKGASTTSAVVNVRVTTSTPNNDPPKNEEPNANVVTPMTPSLPGEFPVAIGFNFARFEFHQAATISWGASSSPHGIKKYIVKKNGNQIYEGPNRTYVDFGIDDGQKYTYEIQAVDNQNNTSKAAVYNRYLRCTWFGWSCSFKQN